MRTRLGLICACIAGATGGLSSLASSPNPAGADLDFFEKKVRPVLVARCYECHSAGKKAKGNLRLDTRDGWAKGGDSGPAIVPGEPDKSLIIQAVRHAKPDLEMPPDSRLPDAEVAILAEWVKRGAPDPRMGEVVAARGPSILEKAKTHWAYQPIKVVAPPTVNDAGWPSGQIDRYALAALEARSLRPAAEASPEVLVRRLYFDLTGLPPTPEEIDAYLADRSADRYERLVGRLLASPRFGERWGRHWLDVARFGESLTLRGFVIKDAWRYRDYVIDAFNADRPFDLFMREQVSGDLMTAADPAERRRQIVASEFLTIGNTNLEEQDKRQLDMDVVDEQLDTLGKAFLGQTIGCARCHDHKFDPIPTKDYYGLAGILRGAQMLEHANVSKWVEMPLPTAAGQDEAIRKHEAEIAELSAKVKAAKAALAKGKKKAGGGRAEEGVTAIADLPGVVVDDTHAKRVGTWKASTKIGPYIGEGYLVEDERGDGQARTLTFILPESADPGKYDVRLAYTSAPARGTHVNVTVFSADGEKTVLVNMREAPPIGGHFVSLGQHSFEKNGQSFVIVSNQDAGGDLAVDAVQFLPAEQAGADVAGAAADAKAAIAKGDLTAATLKKMEAELKRLTDAGPKRETAQVVRERTGPEVGDIRIHVRGSPHTLGDVAPRGFLSAVTVKNPPTIPAKQSGRLELGQWLSAPDNPLPARVTANRVWHWLFGAGLVRSVDNFGTTGESPSHPELLDHLATQLAQNHWSIKSLVRQIVLSRTYRQSIHADVAAASIDPENRLLSHQNRRRLDAECLRDAMLAASGQLKLDAAPPGMTYKPGLSSDFAYKSADTRRSVYLPAFRNSLPEVFEAFDFADPSVGTGRRSVSTVAPQGLFMLNHPFVAEQAIAAAERLLATAEPDNDLRLRKIYRTLLGRAPTAGEARVAQSFVKEAGGSKDAWAQVIHAVFGSIDFRYVE